jgi:hypothetical protein
MFLATHNIILFLCAEPFTYMEHAKFCQNNKASGLLYRLHFSCFPDFQYSDTATLYMTARVSESEMRVLFTYYEDCLCLCKMA